MNPISNGRIVDYLPAHQAAFAALNEQWIKQYFTMEANDYKTLHNPQTQIIDNGGHIFCATIGDEVVGVCALIKSKESAYEFEIAKMAVSATHQGKGLGEQLLDACVQKAKSLHAKRLYLESNTQLQPAIRLYKKMGFVEVVNRTSPGCYQRCNIYMQLTIT